MIDSIKIEHLQLDNEKLAADIYYLNDVLDKNHLAREIRSNVGGDQIHTHKDVQNMISDKLNHIKLFNIKAEKFFQDMLNDKVNDLYMWWNINTPGSYNNVHCHVPKSGITNILYSFVYYVSTPEDSGNIIFIEGNQKHEHEPSVGELLIFDPRLEHCVEPNLSEVDRISIAGNVHI